MNEKLNSKHEIRNPKQARILKIRIFKTEKFLILTLEFRICFEIRYSDFGFFNNLFRYTALGNISFRL